MSEDVKTNVDSEINTDQENENEVNIDDMSPEELDVYVQKRKEEVIKLNSIIERKGKVVKDLKNVIGDDVETKNEITKPSYSSDERTERLELKVDYGYPDEVIEHLMTLGGKNALKNPITKKVADDMANEIKTRRATDIPDGPQGTVDRRIKVSDLEGLSTAEMEKILPHKEL